MKCNNKSLTFSVPFSLDMFPTVQHHSRTFLEVPNLNTSPLIANKSILEMISSPFSSPLPSLSFAPSSHHPWQQSATPPTGRYKPLPLQPKDEIIPSKQILSVLKLLERMDEDVVREVRRVRESLQEAFTMVREYADAENQRLIEQKERREKQQKETKEVDDDFWLNA